MKINREKSMTFLCASCMGMGTATGAYMAASAFIPAATTGITIGVAALSTLASYSLLRLLTTAPQPDYTQFQGQQKPYQKTK